jgi:hypothetical protein
MAVDWSTWGPVLAGAGATGVTAYMSQRNRNRDREDAETARAEDRADRAATNTLDLASRESLADPFRHQNAQIASLAGLDRIRTAQRGTTSINVPPEMQRFMPTRSGGYSYEASPDLRTAAGLLQRSVASGQGAPTMTDPANYGRTGALNLNDPGAIGMGAPRPMAPAAPGASGGAPPRHGSPTAPPSAPGTMSSSFFGGGGAAPGSASYSTNDADMGMNLASGNPAYQNYRRRREGAGGAGAGAKKGFTYGSALGPAGMAGGALIGAVAGAITNNAESAYSDFYLEDAKQILRDATAEMWGESATEEQIEEAIVGQGWEPGDRWVGQESLDYILQQWAKRAQPQGATEDEEIAPSYSGLFA